MECNCPKCTTIRTQRRLQATFDESKRPDSVECFVAYFSGWSSKIFKGVRSRWKPVRNVQNMEIWHTKCNLLTHTPYISGEGSPISDDDRVTIFYAVIRTTQWRIPTERLQSNNYFLFNNNESICCHYFRCLFPKAIACFCFIGRNAGRRQCHRDVKTLLSLCSPLQCVS